MTKTNQFDYEKYQLASAIYSYAERLVMYPNDPANIAYCRSEAERALLTCRNQKVNWLARSETCRGKRLAGRVSVVVETGADTNYGFSHYQQYANRIYNILRAMWLRDIAGMTTAQVTDPQGIE